MITYRCDHCRDEIGSIIRITIDAAGSDNPEHFCSITCLTTWAVTNRVGVPGLRPGAAPDPVPPAPERDSPAATDTTAAARPTRDTVKRICDLCGREGTRRFMPGGAPGGTGWKCSPTASACIGNRPEPVVKVPNLALKNLAAPASIPCAKPEAAQVKPPASDECNIGGRNSTPNVASASEPTRTLPRTIAANVTAHCNDCTRTWTLTGRVLEMAIEAHELKHSHIVTALIDTADAPEVHA